MSLYEGNECPSCDGPTEQRGEVCVICRQKALIAEAETLGLFRQPFSKAEQVRQALNAIAIAMHGDRPQRHAFRHLAECADDKSLEQLARMLKR